MVKYSAILVCGNYHGVIGYAKAKGPAVATALQKVCTQCLVFCRIICLHRYSTILYLVCQLDNDSVEVVIC